MPCSHRLPPRAFRALLEAGDSWEKGFPGWLPPQPLSQVTREEKILGPCPLNTDTRATAMVNPSRLAALRPVATPAPSSAPLMGAWGPLQGLLHLSGLLSFLCHHCLPTPTTPASPEIPPCPAPCRLSMPTMPDVHHSTAPTVPLTLLRLPSTISHV